MKKNNEISICKGDICVNASGNRAKQITAAAAFTFICIGIASLLKAFR